jgi:hypothetical protein
MKLFLKKTIFLLSSLLFITLHCFAQGEAKVSARIDATHIAVGDQVRLFIEAEQNPNTGKLQWATIPDSFNHLEVVEKGKIDTVKQGSIVVYRQRLLITGFDSGAYEIPGFTFSEIPNSGTAYTLQTDSFQLAVQTMAVDTTKPFKGIKGIMFVKATWLDYIWYIIGGIIFILLVIFVTIYFIKNKKAPAPLPKGPQETLQQKTLRILAELDQQQLWQHHKVKEYYTQLTDVIRVYIEERFHTHAMELTTDELLAKARINKEMQPYLPILSSILSTADMAKFAKAQPLPIEHTEAMENARQFVNASKPVVTENTPTQS